jgi:hypothetical protein
MEVLQGHPRSFSRERSFKTLLRKSHVLNLLHRFAQRGHPVWLWLKLAIVGSSRAQFGHSATQPEDRSRHQATLDFLQSTLGVSRLDQLGFP